MMRFNIMAAVLMGLACLGSHGCGNGTGAGPGDAGPSDTTDTAGDGSSSPVAAVAAGASVRVITPVFEPYTDENENRRWDPGEPFLDHDKDGEIDTLYMGGFGVRQPTGVHDDLTARTAALGIDDALFTFTAVDALALSLGRTKEIESRVGEALATSGVRIPDLILVAATHTHAAPDNTGIFGPESLKGAWDADYLDLVVEGCVGSILDAIAAMEPAELVVTSADGTGLVRDIVPPEVTDPYVGIVQARSTTTGKAIATMVSVANHPETAWGDNTLISADYPRYERERIEETAGGVALHFSADLGLMQTPEELGERGFERASLVGREYADRVLAAIEASKPLEPGEVAPTLARGEPRCVLQNAELFVAVSYGVAEGYKDYLYDPEGDDECDPWGCFDLPVSVLRLGDVLTVVTIPGEMTPELVVGGIAAPDEPDWELVFPDAPPEQVIVDHVKTQYRFLVGLAGAEVGYLYPKVTYAPADVFSQSHGPGPDAGGCINDAVVGLLNSVEKQVSP